MNNFKQNSDPIHDLMKKHELNKPPGNFTDKVMGMVKSGVILEEDTEPIIKTQYLIAAAVAVIGVFLAGYVFDLSFLGAESIKNFINTQQIAGVFSSYLAISENIASLFEGVLGNNIFVISILTIALLVGIDQLFRKKIKHAYSLVI